MKNIQQLVSKFVDELEAIVRKTAMDEMDTKIAAVLGKAKASGKGRDYIRAAHKRTPEELEKLKERIKQVLGAEPGMRSEQIQEKLEVGPAELQLPLRQLLEDGELKAKGVARGRQYWVK